MNRMDCHPIRQKSMAKIFPSSEKYSLRWDLFISQAAVKDLQKSKGGEDWEIDSLLSEVANAKDEAAAVMQLLHGAESVVKAFRSMTQRMIPTQKEMVMMVLRRGTKFRTTMIF